MRVKALVVAPQPFFSPRGTPFSVYYRTLVTAELGVEIDLLTYGEGQDVDIPGVRIVRIPRFALLGNVKIGPSPLKLFLDVFIAAWTIALLVRHRYDIVHAHEEAVFFCRVLKPLFGFKLVYDMHSSLPQQLTNFEFTTSRLLIGLFRKLEESALRASAAVITICPDLADYARPIVADEGRHFLIENSIFDEVKLVTNGHRPDPAEEAAPARLPDGRRLIVYAGTLEPYQGIDILVRAFALVRRAAADAYLLVVGGSPAQVEHYAGLARELGVADDCTFTGRVPQRLAKHYCSLAAVQVSPRLHGTNTPLKVYEQLASGIPLVATDIYSHTQVLDDSVAVLVKPEPQDLADGLTRVLSRADEGARRAAAAQALYAEKYSRDAYVNKMRALLATLH